MGEGENEINQQITIMQANLCSPSVNKWKQTQSYDLKSSCSWE